MSSASIASRGIFPSISTLGRWGPSFLSCRRAYSKYTANRKGESASPWGDPKLDTNGSMSIPLNRTIRNVFPIIF